MNYINQGECWLRFGGQLAVGVSFLGFEITSFAAVGWSAPFITELIKFKVIH